MPSSLLSRWGLRFGWAATCIILANLIAPLAVDAQTSGRETEESPLEELSRRSYSSRQKATLEIWGNRQQTRQQVQEAARDGDPEVAARANWILRQWRRGAMPNTPPHIARMLQRSDDPAALQELLEVGQFAAAVVAVEESAGTINRELLQRRLSAAMTRRYPVYVKLALEQDTLGDLLKLIDLIADNKELAVTRIQLMQLLGIEFGDDTLLPTSSETWPERLRTEALVAIHAVMGDPERAVEVARAGGSENMRAIAQMLAGQWDQMAKESAEAARRDDIGVYEQTRLWSHALLAADRCQNQAIFQEAVSNLSSTDPSSRYAVDLAWKSLAGHGQVDAALTLFEKSDVDDAAVIAVSVGRGPRAFTSLGYPIDQIDLKIDDWIDEAIAAQRSELDDERVSNLAEPMRRLLGLMRCLLGIGREDAAWAIAHRLCTSDVDVQTIPVREYVLSYLASTIHRDWTARLAGLAGQQSFSMTSQRSVAGAIRGVDELNFGLVRDAVDKHLPGRSFASRLHITYELLSGRTPEGFDLNRDLTGVYDKLMTRNVQSRDTYERMMTRTRVRLTLPIVKMFATHGRSDLADRCLTYMIESGNVDAALHKAESELFRGRGGASEVLYEMIWQRIQGRQSSPGLRIRIDDVDVACKALIGQWVLAKRRHDLATSDRLLYQIRVTLCAPSTELRDTIAGYLGQHGEMELASEAYTSLLPMAAIGSPDGPGLYSVAWQYSRLIQDDDIANAAMWYDLAASGTLESTDYRSVAYVTLPLDVRRWLLRAAIAQKDFDLAKRHLYRIEELDPVDIDSAEGLLPELREAGATQIADQFFERFFERGRESIKAFPFDATRCNNLAWVAAMNGKRLDEALELAERAVALEPDSAIYRDTLAEVLFLLGRTREALQVEQACVLDDPGQWHLHQQIEKYQAALDAASQ